MTRDELQLEMLRIYDEHSHLFKEVKIERLKFMQWIESFKVYGDLRKAFTYIKHKMIPKLEDMHRVFVHKPASVWEIMKKIQASHPDIITLRGVEFHVKEAWQNRPRPRRLS